jgi:hypothetical protein
MPNVFRNKDTCRFQPFSVLRGALNDLGNDHLRIISIKFMIGFSLFYKVAKAGSKYDENEVYFIIPAADRNYRIIIKQFVNTSKVPFEVVQLLSSKLDITK